MQFARCFLLYFLTVCLYYTAGAQPGTTVDLKKPAKYENRTLASEKTTDDDIKSFRRFYQNTITHYNYVFNADLRLNEIIDIAKQGFRDDYTRLLPYYNYTLDATAANTDIDTIIYKCNAGILLHDLRSDWVDDLYFLMGKAYYLRKNFDSAEHVFLYINYAFAPKEDGYDVPVGSNASGTEFSIATKEKNKILSTQPKRNEDIIWVAKNYIEQGKFNEASSILQMLRYDPNFPGRLQPELHETIGYLYYKSGQYDSAALHLSKATDMDDNKQDKARREYLTAQLFMASGQGKEASEYFTKSADHTVDPYMAVYASLNAINASDDTADAANKKVQSLLKLAKKDRYVTYRDLIYYTAAQVLMQNNDYTQAYEFARKSLKYNVNDPIQRSHTFMLLGDLDYLKPDYLLAKVSYDSVDANTLPTDEDALRLTTRLTALEVIAANMHTINTEDSLQTVARMPEAERTALIKKTVRQLRKEQGLKDDDNSTFVNPAVQSADNSNGSSAGNDLFTAQAAAKGDWYFNNNSLKSSGFNTFKTTWGNRPDVDNWRRVDAVSKQIASTSKGNPDSDDDSNQVDSPLNSPVLDGGKPIADEIMSGEISYDALMAYLPLTEEKLNESNNKIAEAFFNNGKQFQDGLEDYYAAIDSYDSLLKRYPDNDNAQQALFNLYYCYTKIGKTFSADSVASVLKAKDKDGKFTALLSNQPKNNEEAVAATKEYEKIYNLFIEGNFDKAIAAKAAADSMYGHSYWTQQLLFIESIYYVSKRDDSAAIKTLTSLSQQFPGTPLAAKALTMIDVLQRRSQIEAYLTNLDITRLPDDEPSRLINLSPVENIIDKKEVKIDSVVTKTATNIAKLNVDTAKGITAVVRSYVFNASDQQYVGIILNKVDPVFATETRNAFNRYNQVNFYNQKINITPSNLNDSLSMVLLGPFSDAAAALIYTEKVKPKAASTIIPWLKPEKYTFTIISQSNLDILNDTKDLTGYKEMLEKVLPDKF